MINNAKSIGDFLANPFGVEAKEFEYRIPQVGDRVTLLEGSFSMLSDGVEAMKLARLSYATVDRISKIMFSDEDGANYHYTYEIHVKESRYIIGYYGHCWEYLKEDYNKKIQNK